ncbi:hypothetical protein A2U01_0054351, partial [Trifolium medium]|nr:hypothetical protein [Trifolium medium]
MDIGEVVKFFYRDDNFIRSVMIWVVLAVVALYYYWMILNRCLVL